MKTLVSTALLTAAVTCAGLARQVAGPSEGAPKAAKASGPGRAMVVVETEMKNVDFRLDKTIVLHIRRLRGQLVGKKPGAPPSFDDKNSFLVRIASGEIGISSDSLSDLMNHYAFAYPGAPLKQIKITTEENNRIRLKGIVRKGVDVPSEIEGSLEATPDGQIRFHGTAVKSAHLPVKGLMDLLGLKIADLINLNGARGVRVERDDLLLDPGRLLPAPQMQGRVSEVHIEDGQVVQTFGPMGSGSPTAERPLSPPYPTVPNYMYFRGGALRFGKLTMTDADLQIIDADPKDLFSFYLDEYNRQLVAGYSKSRPNYGLVVYMPDFEKVANGPQGQPALRPPGESQ